MLSKLKWLLCLLSLPLLFSSCFEIIEEINLQNDGSGEMILTINMSKSKTKIASIMLMDSINGYKVPGKPEIQREINWAVAELKKMPGISNVRSTTDFTNYIATIRFNFKEVSNVNHITKTILERQKIKASNPSSYAYDKSKATFSREYKYYSGTGTEYNKLKKEDKEVFKTATYTSIFRFQSPISQYSNKLAKVSKSQKAIMQKCSMPDLIYGKVNVSHQIQLVK